MGPRFPENGFTKIQMMSFFSPNLLSCTKRHMFWAGKKKNRIDGRCQAAWGDSETERQKRIFPSCDMVACSFFALSLFRENEGLYVTRPAVQMSYGSLGKKVSLNTTKIPCQKNILHPSEWGTSGVLCLTACIKKDGLMMHKAFFLTLSILSLAGRCWALATELGAVPAALIHRHSKEDLDRGISTDRNQCFACWLSC